MVENALYPPLESPPQQPSAQLRPEAKAYRVVFRGSAAEYFKIWIVNLALTVVTLGIYGAWAKVRTRQYFFGNTFLDGHPFAYLARPLALLRGMMIVAAAGALYYLTATYSPDYALIVAVVYWVALPALVVLALRFRTYYTAYRGLRFGFVGSFGEAYRALLLWGLAAITLVLAPLARHRQAKFVYGNLRYGSSESRFSAPSGPFYGIYLRVLGLFALFIVAFSVLAVSVGAMAGVGEVADPQLTQEQAGQVIALVFMVPYVAFVLLLQAYVRVRESNLVLSNTAFEQFQLHSDMRVRDMLGLYVTNAVAIVASLGLAIPWVMCRMWRYRTNHLSIVGTGELDQFVAAQDNHATSAAADAAIDFGLEF